MMKKLISCLLSLALLLSVTAAAAPVYAAELPDDGEPFCASEFTKEDAAIFAASLQKVYGGGYPTGEVTMHRASEAAVLCGMCAATPEYSIGIGKLTDREGYVVILGGTDLRSKDENLGIKEDLLSAFNRENNYYSSVLQAIRENIPSGSDLYMYGYSLGGMVLQQVAANWTIRRNYNIENCVAFGSPMITLQRSRIVFLEDSSDIVPLMAPRFVVGNELWKSYDTHIVRDGGYKSFVGGHALSYVESPVWDDVDIFGVVDGNGTLTMDMSEYQTFRA